MTDIKQLLKTLKEHQAEEKLLLRKNPHTIGKSHSKCWKPETKRKWWRQPVQKDTSHGKEQTIKVRVTVDFPSETMQARRQWNGLCSWKRNPSSQNPAPSKNVFKKGRRNKDFPEPKIKTKRQIWLNSLPVEPHCKWCQRDFLRQRNTTADSNLNLHKEIKSTGNGITKAKQSSNSFFITFNCSER